jgi:transposase
MKEEYIENNLNEKFNWSKYNESQTKEKIIFIKLLKELCGYVETPNHNRGRKPTSMKDVIFSVCIKEYSGLSSRRLQSDLKLFKENNYISSEIPFNTLLDNLEKEELSKALTELIELSALPLKQIETDFAIDSTGFSTSRYETFFNMKHKGVGKWRAYRKCHANCGVVTNIITSVEVTKGYCNDNNKFEPLVVNTARNFEIRRVMADKAYLSGKNFKIVQDAGGQAYIPFKSNSSGRGCRENRSLYKQMFRFFRENQEEFLKIYHKRSNVESAFSMIKRKFGNNVKCKKEISQDNEILAKVLVHNICVLIQETFMRNIKIDLKHEFENYVARE